MWTDWSPVRGLQSGAAARKGQRAELVFAMLAGLVPTASTLAGANVWAPAAQGSSVQEGANAWAGSAVKDQDRELQQRSWGSPSLGWEQPSPPGRSNDNPWARRQGAAVGNSDRDKAGKLRPGDGAGTDRAPWPQPGYYGPAGYPAPPLYPFAPSALPWGPWGGIGPGLPGTGMMPWPLL